MQEMKKRRNLMCYLLCETGWENLWAFYKKEVELVVIKGRKARPCKKMRNVQEKLGKQMRYLVKQVAERFCREIMREPFQHIITLARLPDWLNEAYTRWNSFTIIQRVKFDKYLKMDYLTKQNLSLVKHFQKYCFVIIYASNFNGSSWKVLVLWNFCL